MSRKRPGSERTALRLAIRRFMVAEEGVALVEATIFVPILVVMSICVMDFGLVYYNKMEMQNAAQAGAQWAIANGVYNCSSINAAATNATKLPASEVMVTSSEFCACSEDSSGNPVVTHLTSPAACTSAACTLVPNSTCPSGSGVVGNYVTVSATPTTAYHSLITFRLISSTPDISATTMVRIQ
jgi:Flp pilus assembly protein TadG